MLSKPGFPGFPCVAVTAASDFSDQLPCWRRRRGKALLRPGVPPGLNRADEDLVPSRLALCTTANRLPYGRGSVKHGRGGTSLVAARYGFARGAAGSQLKLRTAAASSSKTSNT